MYIASGLVLVQVLVCDGTWIVNSYYSGFIILCMLDDLF